LVELLVGVAGLGEWISSIAFQVYMMDLLALVYGLIGFAGLAGFAG